MLPNLEDENTVTYSHIECKGVGGISKKFIFGGCVRKQEGHVREKGGAFGSRRGDVREKGGAFGSRRGDVSSGDRLHLVERIAVHRAAKDAAQVPMGSNVPYRNIPPPASPLQIRWELAGVFLLLSLWGITGFAFLKLDLYHLGHYPRTRSGEAGG